MFSWYWQYHTVQNRKFPRFILSSRDVWIIHISDNLIKQLLIMTPTYVVLVILLTRLSWQEWVIFGAPKLIGTLSLTQHYWDLNTRLRDYLHFQDSLWLKKGYIISITGLPGHYLLDFWPNFLNNSFVENNSSDYILR